MDDKRIKAIMQACLLSSETPLTLEQLQGVFEEEERPSLTELQTLLAELAKDCSIGSVDLVEVASGYSLRVKSDYAPWVSRLQMEKPSKYSRSLLETLAIIAYKQPVTRADIEEIRGVAVNSAVIKTLMEREWIRIAGYKDLPGKPAVYATTKAFLDYFNLRSISELPQLLEIAGYD